MSAQLEIPLGDTQTPAEATQDGTVTRTKAEAGATEQALREKGAKPAEQKPAEAKPSEAPKPEAKPKAEEEAAPLEIKVPDKVDFAAVAKEYQESEGKLSAQTLKLLEAKGIPEDLVQTFIEGQKARAQIVRSQLAQAVGGEESLTAVLSWAATGLSAEEVSTYNTLLKSPDLSAQKVALQALKSRMEADLGTEGVRVNAEGIPGTRGVEPFRSNAELIAEMRKPQYKNDPAFRAKVAQRLKVSTL